MYSEEVAGAGRSLRSSPRGQVGVEPVADHVVEARAGLPVPLVAGLDPEGEEERERTSATSALFKWTNYD